MGFLAAGHCAVVVSVRVGFTSALLQELRNVGKKEGKNMVLKTNLYKTTTTTNIKTNKTKPSKTKTNKQQRKKSKFQEVIFCV